MGLWQDSKLECDAGTTLVGVSADLSAHHPHAVLCCSLDQTSWTPLVHQPSFAADTALLLTDGTVMVHARDDVAWYRLTPDAFGNYWTGTWTQLANAPNGYSPADFASAVLPDGRVLIEGGEYLAGQQVWTAQGALYNPTTNSPTSMGNPTGNKEINGVTHIGDAERGTAERQVHARQRPSGTGAALFNASTLTWTATGSGKADSYDEEGWTLLPNGKVLTVDTRNGTNSEITRAPARGPLRGARARRWRTAALPRSDRGSCWPTDGSLSGEPHQTQRSTAPMEFGGQARNSRPTPRDR